VKGGQHLQLQLNLNRLQQESTGQNGQMGQIQIQVVHGHGYLISLIAQDIMNFIASVKNQGILMKLHQIRQMQYVIIQIIQLFQLLI